jgi:hypothetical protein
VSFVATRPETHNSDIGFQACQSATCPGPGAAQRHGAQPGVLFPKTQSDCNLLTPRPVGTTPARRTRSAADPPNGRHG